MGAEFACNKIKAKTRNEVTKIYDELVATAKYDHGHSGYTGSFAESPGLTIVGQEFDTVEEAQDYIDNNAKKWENSIAVRIKDSDVWFVGGVFSS